MKEYILYYSNIDDFPEEGNVFLYHSVEAALNAAKVYINRTKNHRIELFKLGTGIPLEVFEVEIPQPSKKELQIKLKRETLSSKLKNDIMKEFHGSDSKFEEVTKQDVEDFLNQK